MVTAEDCFVIGRESYLTKDYAMARDWMKQALQKYDEGLLVDMVIMDLHNELVLKTTGNGVNLDLSEVYDHLAFSEYQLGNIKRAMQYTRDLLQNG